jgi:DNA-directed RNA polymerase specialized sigma24 family protein
MIPGLGDSGLAALAGYVPRVVGGDDAAWKELVAQLEPHLIALLRRGRTLGPLRHNVDDCRAVMINVLERLKKDDYRGLRLFQPWVAANPGKDFGDWIRIVTVNLARDHVSSRLGAAERADDEPPRNKRMLNTLASLLPADDDHRLAFRPLMTNKQLARELMEYAARALDRVQLRALTLWIEGASFEELAAELDLPRPQDATRLVRAALARLRRHFGDQADD